MNPTAIHQLNKTFHYPFFQNYRFPTLILDCFNNSSTFSKFQWGLTDLPENCSDHPQNFQQVLPPDAAITGFRKPYIKD